METMKQYGAWNDKRPSNEEIARFTQEIVKSQEKSEQREDKRREAIEEEKTKLKDEIINRLFNISALLKVTEFAAYETVFDEKSEYYRNINQSFSRVIETAAKMTDELAEDCEGMLAVLMNA